MNLFRFDNFFPDTVGHGFFGRKGGISSGIYESLNCSYQSRDLAENIDENRLRVVTALGGNSLATLKQIHSDICLPIEKSCLTGIEEGDALVTKTPGQIIGCLTADCAPVLLYGEDMNGAPVIGAAHAGWGGALKGVLESTVKGMTGLGAAPNTIRAAIGPCLAQQSYEVDKDFSEPFVREDKEAQKFFQQQPKDKLKFDLQSYVQYRLIRAGIVRISMANIDTYSNEQDYFSYRRATHRGESDYGRQISAISIRTS